MKTLMYGVFRTSDTREFINIFQISEIKEKYFGMYNSAYEGTSPGECTIIMTNGNEYKVNMTYEELVKNIYNDTGIGIQYKG